MSLPRGGSRQHRRLDIPDADSAKFQAALLLDALQCSKRQIRFWMRDRDRSGFCLMSKLDVAARLSNVCPSICLEPFDNFAALHVPNSPPDVHPIHMKE